MAVELSQEGMLGESWVAENAPRTFFIGEGAEGELELHGVGHMDSEERPRSCRHAIQCGICALFNAVALVALLAIWTQFLPSSEPPPMNYCIAEDVQMALPSNWTAEGVTGWSWAMAQRMPLDDKRRYVSGVGWHLFSPSSGYYIGNSFAVPHLGLPSIAMNDAMQGFRTSDARMLGQVTSWPCALAVAATWSGDLTWQWARAIGKEFRAKGANVLLGPSVNVHRIARNGRNAEYLSGEDGFLGAVLAAAYVRGAQEGAGVAAVVKHFLLNQQETNRMSVDSVADERTRWEVYYPPFQAAVEAGVAAVMCSYNFVNGEQACQNDQILNQELKGKMGFKNWVMSDWWALRSSAGAKAGTDQDMPGTDKYFAGLPEEQLNGMVARVLRGMMASGAWNYSSCRVGCDCDHKMYEVNATSEEHAALARRLAAEGAVLLKNEAWPGKKAPVLPLQAGQRVAVLGAACAAHPDINRMMKAYNWIASDYYVVGGSGRVLSRNVVSVLDGLHGRLLKLQTSTSYNFEEASDALKGADVAVVCGGATSSESVDRTSLRLDQEEFLTKVLADATKRGIPTVVVALAPGAFLTPWREHANAILAMFLSGQETGGAAADVLTGSTPPAGKLPVTLPLKEEDAIPPCEGSAKCVYKEKLFGGWHVYDGREVAYPFGHGLSYTEFEYKVSQEWAHPEPSLGEQQLEVQVQNVGVLNGSEILQLYTRFPGESGTEPDYLLRGFGKTRVLEPGETDSVRFRLSARDLSTWNSTVHGWEHAAGSFTVFVGVSSREPRLCGSFLAGKGFGGRPPVSPMQPCNWSDVLAGLVGGSGGRHALPE